MIDDLPSRYGKLKGMYDAVLKVEGKSITTFRAGNKIVQTSRLGHLWDIFPKKVKI